MTLVRHWSGVGPRICPVEVGLGTASRIRASASFTSFGAVVDFHLDIWTWDNLSIARHPGVGL